MRGTFEYQGQMFSYISPEARVPANHPLRRDTCARPDRAEGVEPALFAALCQGGPAIGSAGALAQHAVASGFLRHPFGTAVDGAVGLQPALSLVCSPTAPS